MNAPTDRLSASLADRYRIERELGAGGMATVYLAADLKHDRKVAIKVLKPELAAVLGAERFVQEIKTTAALSHPHILPLFDSGEAGGFLYYVMPYIEGETIRDRLNRERQLGIDEAVRITTEIADALEYAHRHGVIHRDIKPENILLHDGRPMVMDFGIALAVSAAAGGRMTETGLSLGTPHYMSPEQATAEKEITGRSDVYSLASVLYEMLAGAPPHVGGSAQQIIMRIIADSPRPVTELRKSVPPNIAAALGRALEKLPADRFESAKSFAEALGDRHFTTATEFEAASRSGRSLGPWLRSPLSRVAVALLALALVAVAMLLTRRAGPPVTEPLMAFTVVDSMTGGLGSGFALADDGTIIRIRGGQVVIRRAGELTETPLTGPEELAALTPVLSPDGSDIVYMTRSGATSGRFRLRRLSLLGGAATTVWTAPDSGVIVRPFAWARDGWIYVTTFSDSTAFGRLRESGGEIETIMAGQFGNGVVLPGEKAIVGCYNSRSERSGAIVALDLATRDTVSVASEACAVRWSPTGHLLVPHSDGTLRALPFDPARLRVTGPSTPVLSGIAVNNGNAAYELSNTGTLLYVAGPSTNLAATRSVLTLALVSLDGSIFPLPLAATDHSDGGFSPNGKTLAYTRDGQIWIYDMELGAHRRFTRVGTEHHDPVFSPDGKRLAYRALRAEGKGGEVYVQSLEGDTVGMHIGGSPVGDDPIQWLPDGRILSNRGLRSDIVTLNADKSGDPVPVLEADWEESYARVSPDGNWLAYQSTESGRRQLMVRAWPGLDRRSVVADSISSAMHFWSNDGRTLFYVSRDRLMAVSLAGGEILRAESHRVIIASLGGNLAAMHPDGRRFLVFQFPEAATASGRTASRSLIAVTGWLGSLRQRLAAASTR